MKIRTILVSMLALVALASCNKDNNTTESADNAYLSVSLASATPGTYAEDGPGTNNGTADESSISGGMIVVGFAADKSTVKGVYNFTSVTPNAAVTPFKVNADIKHIFVIVNPTTEITNQVNSATTTYAAMNNAIMASASTLTTANYFLMTSAGAAPDDKGLVVVTPSVAASESSTDIAAAQAAALTASVTVKVDRVVAKATLLNNTGMTVTNGSAQIDGWLANATNTKYLPYAELVAYTIDGTTSPAPAVYRRDANFAEMGAAYSTELNWIHNTALPTTWNALDASEYVMENTMAADAQDYNNTSKVVIKAKFAPTGVNLGDSWFRVNGIVKTFAELQTMYATAFAAYTTTTATHDDTLIVTGLDSLAQIFKASPTAVFSDITGVAELDAVANGGYLASTANPCVLQYFQNSVCYYDVNLKHDNNVQGFLLGRWGLVRNNWYSLRINTISQAGLPFVPDPTDPDIVDPENPDPEDPDTNDETSAYISVTITVNPWTTWTQEADL